MRVEKECEWRRSASRGEFEWRIERIEKKSRLGVRVEKECE